jgi:predicted cytidylate kinase
MRHVTISGDLGSGKSSVAEVLAGRLGYRVVSTGAIQRGIAAELGLSTLEANLRAEADRSIDDRIDSVTRSMGGQSGEGIVFDSRMAWHFVPDAFKVRLAADPWVAAERVLGRGPGAVEGYGSLDEAFDAIMRRSASEVRRFRARYGVDITRLGNFDLVLDTSSLGIEDCASRVEACLEGGAKAIEVSPRAVIPAFHLGDNKADDAAAVPVVYSRPFFFAVGGKAALRSALELGAGVVPASLVAEADEATPWGLPASAFPAAVAAGPELPAWETAEGVSFRGLRRHLATD